MGEKKKRYKKMNGAESTNSHIKLVVFLFINMDKGSVSWSSTKKAINGCTCNA